MLSALVFFIATYVANWILEIETSMLKILLFVGAVLILPEGFKLAPKDRISADIKAKTKGVFVQPYSKEKTNILVVGPIAGDKNREIVFPILSPDPATNKEVSILS